MSNSAEQRAAQLEVLVVACSRHQCPIHDRINEQDERPDGRHDILSSVLLLRALASTLVQQTPYCY